MIPVLPLHTHLAQETSPFLAAASLRNELNKQRPLRDVLRPQNTHLFALRDPRTTSPITDPTHIAPQSDVVSDHTSQELIQTVSLGLNPLVTMEVAHLSRESPLSF